MTDRYWKNPGGPTGWETASCWFEDAAGLIPCGIPEDGDRVFLNSGCMPNSGPGVLTLSHFEWQGGDNMVGSIITLGITIAEGGSVVYPESFGNFYWAGDARLASTLVFESEELYIAGKLGDNVTLTSKTQLTIKSGAVIGHHATFNNGVHVETTIGDYATFNDNSDLRAPNGIAGDYATFNDNAVCPGFVGDYATFNNNTQFWGVAGNHATFNDNTSICGGIVGSDATFKGMCSTDVCMNDITLHGGKWDSDGVLHMYNNAWGTQTKVILLGDLVALRQVKLKNTSSGTGRIIIPRREMNVLIGDAGSQIKIDTAYGYTQT